MLRNLTGQKFGMLTILGPSFREDGRTRVKCICDCGTKVVAMENNILRGNSESCGCRCRGRNKTHGLSYKTPIYALWKNMRQRCFNKRSPFYFRYGGRGITVCDRWADFTAFMSDMGERPEGMTLERSDNNGPYSPENCRWASRIEQARNRSNNILLEYRGETKTISTWEADLKTPRGMIWNRLALGWSVERTLTEPVNKEKRRKT